MTKNTIAKTIAKIKPTYLIIIPITSPKKNNISPKKANPKKLNLIKDSIM
jgi:hypothetical protein